jgi:hypothetical protein
MNEFVVRPGTVPDTLLLPPVAVISIAPEFKALQDGKAYFVDLLERKICSPRPARHARRSPAQFFVPA